jgi:cyclophilin family peptidyl-prolyl cis-trans isomerase
VQGGDPSGTGKGGESIYGQTFEDEIVDVLRVRCFFSAFVSVFFFPTKHPLLLTPCIFSSFCCSTFLLASEQHDQRGVVSMANKGPATNGTHTFFPFVASVCVCVCVHVCVHVCDVCVLILSFSPHSIQSLLSTLLTHVASFHFVGCC